MFVDASIIGEDIAQDYADEGRISSAQMVMWSQSYLLKTGKTINWSSCNAIIISAIPYGNLGKETVCSIGFLDWVGPGIK